MTDQQLRRLRNRIAGLPTNARGRRQYDAVLRQEIATYAAGRHADGESYSRIAEALGLSSATLLHWRDKASVDSKSKKRPPGFRPVALRAQEARKAEVEVSRPASLDSAARQVSQPVVVLPGGVRIEGMVVGDLAELLRSLRWVS